MKTKKIFGLYNNKKAVSTGRDLEQHNRLLGVVNKTAELLLTSDSDNLGKDLFEAMDVLARNVDVDRMYIWRSHKIRGKLCYKQEYEWLSDPSAKKTCLAETGFCYIDTLPAWELQFSAGNYINGPLSSFSETEQNILSLFGIRSLLAVPVFIQEKFWGFVSFEDCQRARFFSKDEVSILRSGSLLLSSAIVKHNNKVMIETQMRQQELMSDISQSFLSKEPLGLLINEALRKMGEFLRASRAAVIVADKNADICKPAHIWIYSGQWKPKITQLGFSETIKDCFPRHIPESGYISSLCCNDIENEFHGQFSVLNILDVKSFIWTPIYIDGELWGLITVEECEYYRTWSESDVQLVASVSSAIAGAVALAAINEERSDALKQAVKASKAKGDFLANMSHEMRTPLNAIIGMTAIGKNSRDLEKKDYSFEKIENASSHLLGVINDILDMSKIEANKFEISPVTFSFEKMLQKVVNVVNFRIEERHQEFTVYIDEKIPRLLVGDDQRLAQVITNLLSNAVKFTPERGRIRLDAKLVAEESGLYTIKIEVSDTGIGISQEQQEKLFISFQQAESGTSRKFGGTGLGLAISKRIVELMGGWVWIDSELGKGATFGFAIKAQKGHDAPFTGMLAQGVNIKNINILVVDDQPEILESFSNILTRFKIKHDVASNGEEALALIKQNKNYDLYFVDWSMPGMDGIELTRKIKEYGLTESGREHDKSVVIMISSSGLSVIGDEAEEAGVDKFLPKPLFPSAIANVINECLGSASLEKVRCESKQEMVDSFDGHTILLVEDVDINREIVLTLLAPTALKIECAENGIEAVEKFAAAPEKYDMIFMDVQMPEMDGYEATQKIRALDNKWAASVPIVAMTANVFREDVEKCLSFGMNDHVGKPVDFNDVIDKLRKYLPYKLAS